MDMHFSTIKICLIWKLCYEAKNKRQAIKVFSSNKDWQVFSWFCSEYFKPFSRACIKNPNTGYPVIPGRLWLLYIASVDASPIIHSECGFSLSDIIILLSFFCVQTQYRLQNYTSILITISSLLFPANISHWLCDMYVYKI